jgi:hypothetical protein
MWSMTVAAFTERKQSGISQGGLSVRFTPRKILCEKKHEFAPRPLTLLGAVDYHYPFQRRSVTFLTGSLRPVAVRGGTPARRTGRHGVRPRSRFPEIPDIGPFRPRHVTKPAPSRSPIADAVEWVSRLTVVALEMVLPGLAGQWLDEYYGFGFLALLGFALGITGGIWHLLVMTKPRDKNCSLDGTDEERRS